MLNRQRPGQSMLEMVIAIGVITISTLATSTLIVTTINTGRVSQARVEAANLAREGVEIVRGVRDSNWLKADQNLIDGSGGTTVQWNDTGSTSDGFSPLGGTYLISLDPATGRWTLTACPGACANDQVLLVTKYNGTATNFFTQGGCPPLAAGNCTSTRYRRTITIAPPAPSNENVHVYPDPLCTIPSCYSVIEYLTITSTVRSPGALTKNMVVSERLYNWK